MPSMKRYLLICNFYFDQVIHTLLLLSLDYAKGGGYDQGRALRNYSRR
jgi:hypothetical protein